MRPIKFRAWDKEDSRWLTCDEMPIIGPKKTDKDTIYQLRGLGYIEYSQFTGLLDRNGKEIYEGDLLGFSGRPHLRPLWEVKWERCGFNVPENCSGSGNPWVVYGNIYENPEMLEAK